MEISTHDGERVIICRFDNHEANISSQVLEVLEDIKAHRKNPYGLVTRMREAEKRANHYLRRNQHLARELTFNNLAALRVHGEIANLRSELEVYRQMSDRMWYVEPVFGDEPNTLVWPTLDNLYDEYSAGDVSYADGIEVSVNP